MKRTIYPTLATSLALPYSICLLLIVLKMLLLLKLFHASTLSDHELLVVVRKINAGKLPPRSIECRNFSNYDQMTFIEDLEKCSWDDVYSERDVNSAWSKWKELFLSVCNKHAPIRHKVLRGLSMVNICSKKAYE